LGAARRGPRFTEAEDRRQAALTKGADELGEAPFASGAGRGVKRFAFIAASLLLGTPAWAGTAQRETHGTREFRVYAPDGDVTGKPLVVILHGCTQTADDVADASRMDALADEKDFVVAYPEQSATSG